MNSTALTQSQLLIWTGQAMEPDSPLYNMAFTFEIAGPIDVDRFTQAFSRLVEDCDAMRTIFRVADGGVEQVVLNLKKADLLYLDWSDGQTLDLKEWAEDRTAQLFNLEERLYDAALIKKSDNSFVWYLNQHHLITDAWGVTLQYNHLIALYEAEDITRVDPLPSYSDYIALEANQSSDSDFWAAKSQERRAQPKLYGERGQIITSNSTRHNFSLSPSQTEGLRDLCKEPDLRTWNTQLALFQIIATTLFALIRRVSDTDDELALGTISHNRSSKKGKNTPGLFIELFPLHVDVALDDSWGALYQKVGHESLQFLKHAGPGRTSAVLNSQFNTVLNFINAKFDQFKGFAVKSTWVHCGHSDPRHAIRLHVMDFDDEDQIHFYIDLNNELFLPSQQQAIKGHFITLLDAFISDRSMPISATPILTPNEQGRLKTLNDTSLPSGPLLVKQLDAVVNANPNAIALECDGEEMSYATLWDKSGILAAYMQAEGVAVGDRVGVYCRRSPMFTVSILALLRCGAIFVPISRDIPKTKIETILSDAGISLVLTDTSVIPYWASGVRTINTDDAVASARFNHVPISGDSGAYILYTSGSTGKPKGVLISHHALSNYLHHARATYCGRESYSMALCTSVGFDLTITSLFLPLLTGARQVIYPEPETGPDLAILNAFREDKSNIIKLTPSHLALVQGSLSKLHGLKVLILGGEDLKVSVANAVLEELPNQLVLFNEYGPTEATVGCIVHRYQGDLIAGSVPIGKPIQNMQVHILGPQKSELPIGTPGEIYLSGVGLASGYWNDEARTQHKFVTHAGLGRIYATGDWGRIAQDGAIHFMGRRDEQIKLRGRRIELGEVETALQSIPGVTGGAVKLIRRTSPSAHVADHNCTRCGLPSNYPRASFDDHGVCHLCRSFEKYQARVEPYFRTHEDLRILLAEKRQQATGDYDCIMLLSGGKDSSYALAQLVELGCRVLAFTLDNGYISEGAKQNVRRVCTDLGVDHVFGQTPHMNDIFVDSLHRHSNVCNGCFKTIYTLSLQLALDKGIPAIVTGLSRGQFFETRLTEELFVGEQVAMSTIDDTILEARRLYHGVDDAVKQLLDTNAITDGEALSKVQFIDYYRFTDVTLAEMLHYLDQKLPWVRPTDTGRSTNCLINQLGIFVHKKKEGYSNYAFPYSWDVRMGHKTRDASLDEINEAIDEPEVERMMAEIGYHEVSEEQLVAYYSGANVLDQTNMQQSMRQVLGDYAVPTRFMYLEDMPLNANGKVERSLLPDPSTLVSTELTPPEGEIEDLVWSIWSEVMMTDQIGVNDQFLSLGGTSLSAIRIAARLNKSLEMTLPVSFIFQFSTIRTMSTELERKMIEILDSQ